VEEVILITSWLEDEHVERIRECAPWAEVVHEPSLLRPARYAADHKGRDVVRDEAGEARWRDHLARATILFDFDQTHLDDLPEAAPRVRWIQATSAGIGHFVQRMGYAARMPDTVFTTASGVHARPLAEFALMCMLGHVRGLLPTLAAQRRRHWERFAGTDLEGRTAVMVGYGAIGREIGRMAAAFGLHVVGVRRSVGNGAADADPEVGHTHEVYAQDALAALLPRADFLILAAPHTPETDGMIGAAELAALPPGAALVNVGRGALVDEPALVAALEDGTLGAAYLDVFAEEPLPADSPLWGLPNVLVSPHSGSTSDRENRRITELFCDNLRHYREGRGLRNVLEPERLY
jgi:phosphoglycerate dehydrogenase-like enzyme